MGSELSTFYDGVVEGEPNLAAVASGIGDPACEAMLDAMMGGRAVLRFESTLDPLHRQRGFHAQPVVTAREDVDVR
jgi:hypothetical protein